MVMESIASSIIQNTTRCGGEPQQSFLPDKAFGETSSNYCAVALADISGFTPLTERLTASSSSSSAGIEELSTILNSYFSQMIRIVESYGGDVIKFAGDALLIAFKHPSAKERSWESNNIPRDEDCISPSSQQRSSWKNKVQEFQSSTLSPRGYTNQTEQEEAPVPPAADVYRGKLVQ